MHELALADAVVAIAAEHAGDRRVTVVEIQVGALRQVVPSALEFSFALVAEGTVVEGAELRIESVAARVACRDCPAEGRVDGFPLVCPVCGSTHVDVVAGDELRVEALELEEQEEEEPIEVFAGRRKM